jgi:hypothetical protein
MRLTFGTFLTKPYFLISKLYIPTYHLVAALPLLHQNAFILDHSATTQVPTYHLVVALPPQHQNSLLRRFRTDVIPSCAQSCDANWLRWVSCCSTMDFKSTCCNQSDAISILQVLSHLSMLAQWKRPYAPLARHTGGLGP